MLAHRLPSNPPRHEKPKELVAIAPNQVWSWDITYLQSSILGMFYYLYLVVDIYSRKIVAWELADYQSDALAARMIRKACAAENVHPNQLFIHSDNGGPMKGAAMLATLRRLGVLPSFNRPNVSDDNAFSEALFRTLKYRPSFPRRPFATIDEAKDWVKDFVYWYNNEHLHSGICFVTPNARHNQDDIKILEFRKKTYEDARKKNPHRWIKEVRDWTPVPFVALNPLRESELEVTKITA